METNNHNRSSLTPVRKQEKLQIILSLIFAFILIGGLFYRHYFSEKELAEYPITRFYMDTFVEVNIVSGDRKKAMEAREAAFSVFKDLEKEFNLYEPESLLNKVNSLSQYAVEEDHFLTLINMGLKYSRKTDGAFDMTLGGVRLLYPIGKENPIPPEKDAVEKALAISGYKKVRIKDNRIEKPRDMLIDTGGILKGYAVDLAIRRIKEMGITDALINGGGNIRVMGKNVKGDVWKIGLQHPRIPEKIIAVLPLKNEAVATSGDYQRYFYHDKKRYHHIIDPATGEPAGRAISATVICPDAVTADAYSTAVFVMGKRKGIEFLEKENLQGIIIDEEGVEMTEGLKRKVKIYY